MSAKRTTQFSLPKRTSEGKLADVAVQRVLIKTGLIQNYDICTNIVSTTDNVTHHENTPI